MRIALIADTHLSSRAPECVANWHAARRAVERQAVSLTIHLGDITLEGQTHRDELGFASRLMQQWPSPLRCVPGNHDLGDGSGEVPLDTRLTAAYGEVFGTDRWVVESGDWKLLGIDAQLLGSGSAQERALWRWIEDQAGPTAAHAHTALFLHRPLLRPQADEQIRKGRYVAGEAADRLLDGPLKSTLRLVVSGHTHQYRDVTVEGVRHVWMPSAAFIFPDDMQMRIGEKLVGIGLLDIGDGDGVPRFDLWCPDGMTRHDVRTLEFLPAQSKNVATATEETGHER